MNTLAVADRGAWREWLAANHEQETEIWLVYYKKGSGKTSIDYEASVEEAICYGWVDVQIKGINEEKFARRFTPRKAKSNWSESNIRRVEKMMAAGMMTPAGLALVEAAKENGQWKTE